MKKKLYAFVVMLCLFAISCFSGCTLVSKDVNAEREQNVIVVGERALSTNDIINSFYSFYQQNQYYFYYSDTETIMNSFYKSVISREVVLEEAEKLFNTDVITLTDEDYQDIWNDVFDYFHGQVDGYEKSLLAYNGIKEESEDYPTRLKDEKSDEKETEIKYEEYVFEEFGAYEAGVKGTLATVKSKFDDLVNFIKTKYVKDTESDTRELEVIEDAELDLRGEAFDKYVASLMLSAKLNGKEYGREAVLIDEIQRVLDAHVESALYEEYKEYVNALVLTDDYKKLSDEAVVNEYVNLLGKDSEKYENYTNYTKIITSTENESLILYHNGEESKYFTVQHMLVQFDDATVAALKEDPGYSTAIDITFRNYYENNVRKLYADELYEDTVVEYRNAGTKLEDSYDIDTTKKYSVKTIMELYSTLTSSMEPEDKVKVFNKLSWEFSQDKLSLVNELSNVLGYAISSESYEHGRVVKDFANGARELYNDGEGNVGDINYVVSDYGIHILALTGEYTNGAVAEVVRYEEDAADGSYKKGDINVAATKTKLEEAKVSSLTNQSVYEYIYDQLKEKLVGESGTFFTDYVNKKVAEYTEEGKIKENKDRPTYDELIEALK